jgi:phosphoenolpyruvate carboxykinase (GTP)
VPGEEDLDLKGLDLPRENLAELLRVDPEAWMAEVPKMEKFFAQFGERLPKRLRDQLEGLRNRLGTVL